MPMLMYAPPKLSGCWVALQTGEGLARGYESVAGVEAAREAPSRAADPRRSPAQCPSKPRSCLCKSRSGAQPVASYAYHTRHGTAAHSSHSERPAIKAPPMGISGKAVGSL
eukprot:4840584-Pyramimonas_sp.AAC.1